MNSIKCASIQLLLGCLLLAPAATTSGAEAEGEKAGSSTNLLHGSGINATTVTTPSYVGFERAVATTQPPFALPPTPTLATKAAKPGFGDHFQNSKGADVLDWCANGSSSGVTLGVACCDQARARGDSVGLRAGGRANARSSANQRTTFRFFNGALISGGGPGESGERPDWERAAFSGFPNSRSWVGPDPAREPQGLRLFSWRW